LVLYADNEGALYPQRQAIEENLRKKYRKGQYDHSKAWKAWMFWMEPAAKAYAKDFARVSEWSTIFTKSTRELAAKEKADEFRDVLEVEETVVVPKPKAKKKATGSPYPSKSAARERRFAARETDKKKVHYSDFGWDAHKPFPNDGKGETEYRQGKATIKIRYAPRGTYAAEIITDGGGWLPGLGGPTRAQALEATKNLLPRTAPSTTDPAIAKYTERSYTRPEAEALLEMAYPYTKSGPNYKRNIHDAAADLILALQNEMDSPVSTFAGILALRLAALGGHGREGLLAKLKKATTKKKATKKATKKKATKKATKKKATKKKVTTKKKVAKKKATKKKTTSWAADARKKRAKKKNVRKKAKVAKKAPATKRRTPAEEARILRAWQRGDGSV